MARAMYPSLMGWMVSLTTIFNTSAEAGNENRRLATLRIRSDRRLFMDWTRRMSIVPLFGLSGVDFLWCGLRSRWSGFFIRPSRQIRAAGNEARSPLVGDIGPRPLHDYQQPVAETDQEENMNEEPC